MGSGQSRKPRSSRTRASQRYDLRGGSSSGHDLHDRGGGEYYRATSETLNNVRRVKLPDSVSKTLLSADHDSGGTLVLAKSVDNSADGKIQQHAGQHATNGKHLLPKVTNSQRKPKRVTKAVSEDASKFAAAKSRQKEYQQKSQQQQQQHGNVKGQKRLHHTVHAGDKMATEHSSDVACVLALGGLRSTLVDLAPYASAFVVVPLNLEHQDAVGDLLKVR